jgi:hypothetical protein
MPTTAKWFSPFILLGSWLLAAAVRGASRSLAVGRRILGRIFLKEGDPAWVPPLDRPSRSIRYLKHLGRLRRREGTIACDLGSLAKAVHRQGLQEHARRFARGAFDRWCRARIAERQLHRKVEDALKEHVL